MVLLKHLFLFLIMDTLKLPHLRPQCLVQCETTGYWQTLWSSSLVLLWYCCGSSLLSTVLVSDNGAPPVSLTSLTERSLAHCSGADTLHCHWFPLSSGLQAASWENSACICVCVCVWKLSGRDGVDKNKYRPSGGKCPRDEEQVSEEAKKHFSMSSCPLFWLFVYVACERFLGCLSGKWSLKSHS